MKRLFIFPLTITVLCNILLFPTAGAFSFLSLPILQSSAKKCCQHTSQLQQWLIHPNKNSNQFPSRSGRQWTKFAAIPFWNDDKYEIETHSSGTVLPSFDPLELSSSQNWSSIIPTHSRHNRSSRITPTSSATSETQNNIALTAIIPPLTLSTLTIQSVNALDSIAISNSALNPDTFRPICPASDVFYRFLQSTAESIVGSQSASEYAPLISGGLLRVRLELCVIESFFGEAVVPFIEKEGLGWVFPLKETVETFLAGTIFALASTFILVGSSKILAVVVTYGDAFLGLPCRLIGGFGYNRARGLPLIFDVGVGPWKKRLIGPPMKKKNGKEEEEEDAGSWSKVQPKDLPFVLFFGAFKVVGETSKVTREVTEAADLFVGRYLSLVTTAYIGFKFLHFKIFPDFPAM